LRRLDDLGLIANVATGIENNADLVGDSTRASGIGQEELSLGFIQLILER